MNLLHLKYAIEVDKTRSISKAAENLFMGQPNLSRAIKELEKSLGITIFRRTSKGICPTARGVEFLAYAKSILAQVSEVEALYRKDHKDRQRFSISIPRASYIASAFTSFVQKLDNKKAMELYYKETNSMRAINNVLSDEYNLGIIRYQSDFEQYFLNLLTEKGLLINEICEFSYRVLMSREHPLAACDTIELGQLCEYIEIAHGDPFVPTMPQADAKKAEFSEQIDKRIFVFERGSQFELLCSVKNSYMW
ncbi:MAG: LysR family transcriptional regulator, partial [Angelakisella sp.]